MTSAFAKVAHRRYNPLMDEWIIVSPQRICRPWGGQLEVDAAGEKASTAQQSTLNPLSPGAIRASGATNPHYESTFLFQNDFPALDIDEDTLTDDALAESALSTDPLFASAPVHGKCHVLCFHPNTSKTLPLMESSEVLRVVDEWCRITREYQQKRSYKWLQIFENRGAAVGCSNIHPHCQIWACAFLPSLVKRRDQNQRNYLARHGSNLLLDYIHRELSENHDSQNRLIITSEHWVVLVPFWACWPFETMLLPRGRHIRWLWELTEPERRDLVKVIQELLTRYDNLFKTDFPYSMGWFQAPFTVEGEGPQDYEHWQLHAIYQPPLLRSATVRKFMSGFELLAEPQRDLLPEQAAALLRDVQPVHYARQKC